MGSSQNTLAGIVNDKRNKSRNKKIQKLSLKDAHLSSEVDLDYDDIASSAWVISARETLEGPGENELVTVFQGYKYPTDITDIEGFILKLYRDPSSAIIDDSQLDEVRENIRSEDQADRDADHLDVDDGDNVAAVIKSYIKPGTLELVETRGRVHVLRAEFQENDN